MKIDDFMKHIGITFAIAVGTFFGIFIGYHLLPGQGSATIISNFDGDVGVPNELKLTFGSGDPLPNILLERIDGGEINLRQYLNGKKTAILITAIQCPPCVEFLEQWNQIVTPKLKDDAQEIVFVTHELRADYIKLRDYLKGKREFHFIRSELERKMNATYFPTAIAIDENGIVVSVQYGKQEGINYEILKFLTTHDI